IIIILIISTIALLKTSMSSFNELLINNNYNNLNKSDIFYQTINTNVPGGIGYSFLLRNLGTTNCYENIVIRKTNEVTSYATEFYYHQGAAIPIESSEYQGEVYLLNSTEVLSNYSNCSNSNNTNTSRYTNCNRNISNTANYTFWSPNKLIVEINTQQADTLIINQNYHEPWKSYSNKQKIPVKNTNDLISVEIKPENKKITLYYLPTSFIIGSIITITTITGIIIWTRKKKKFI
ncbi:MAG: YfhO family protein, partial [Nanoarchaeota archaeon]|nr:YfhO family protein [Nanoarchaeota archaeon]